MQKIVKKSLRMTMIFIMLGIISKFLLVYNIKQFELILDGIEADTVTINQILFYGLILISVFLINYLSEFPGTKLANKFYLDFKYAAMEKLHVIKYEEYQNWVMAKQYK